MIENGESIEKNMEERKFEKNIENINPITILYWFSWTFIILFW